MVFDLSVFINVLANRTSIKPKTIGKFCHMNIYEEISNQYKGWKRSDIVKNLSSDGINLKEITQHRRSTGMDVEFDNNTPFPIDFASGFLRRSENKRKYYPCVVGLILQKCQFHDKIVVAKKKKKTS